MNKKGIMTTIEKASNLIELSDPKHIGGIIPFELLELSRKHDGVRYYIAECEAGKKPLIEAQTLIIEMLLNEQRGIS